MATKQVEIINGAELIARAAIDAGVSFFAGYPITPASSIYTAMLNKLQARGKVAIAAGDEIAAISMCIGASLTGAKSMTATSAPGLCLMTENIGYAFATETPLLIVLGQRLGPSTGAATQSASGDINFIANLISGGYRIPVIAINSIFNSYDLTIKAINISETLRTPVILLTEKDIIMSQQSIDFDKLQEEKLSAEFSQRERFSGSGFRPYAFSDQTDVAKYLPLLNELDKQVVVTGSFHDMSGNLSKNSPEAFSVAEHLFDKIEKNLDKLSFYEEDFDDDASVLVISFLSPNLSAQAAIKAARQKGFKVRHLTLYTLFPILTDVIARSANQIKTIIVPEINYHGQYADLIRQIFKQDQKLIKINHIADLIDPELILTEIVKHA